MFEQVHAAALVVGLRLAIPPETFFNCVSSSSDSSFLLTGLIETFLTGAFGAAGFLSFAMVASKINIAKKTATPMHAYQQ